MNFSLRTNPGTILLHAKKFVKIECHLHSQKNRKTFQNPDHSVVLADIDDITVMLSLIVLSIIFFHELTLVLSYSIPKFVENECHLHG